MRRIGEHVARQEASHALFSQGGIFGTCQQEEAAFTKLIVHAEEELKCISNCSASDFLKHIEY